MLPSVLHLVLPGAALVCSMMFILWIIHLRIRNASIVDPGWAFGLPLVAVTYALLGSGSPQRKGLAAGMAVLWEFASAFTCWCASSDNPKRAAIRNSAANGKLSCL